MEVTTRELPISKFALKAIIELTGQTQLDVAILMVLRDAIEHRLEKINAALEAYEQKYGMSFQEFETRGRSGELPDRFSYEVESDYFDWDSLVTRKRKLEEIYRWLA
jgi:hypothetical protein